MHYGKKVGINRGIWLLGIFLTSFFGTQVVFVISTNASFVNPVVAGVMTIVGIACILGAKVAKPVVRCAECKKRTHEGSELVLAELKADFFICENCSDVPGKILIGTYLDEEDQKEDYNK